MFKIKDCEHCNEFDGIYCELCVPYIHFSS